MPVDQILKIGSFHYEYFHPYIMKKNEKTQETKGVFTEINFILF